MKRIGLCLMVVLLVAVGALADWPKGHKVVREDMLTHGYIVIDSTPVPHPGPGLVVLKEKDYEFLIMISELSCGLIEKMIWLGLKEGTDKGPEEIIESWNTIKRIEKNTGRIDRYIQKQLKK